MHDFGGVMKVSIIILSAALGITACSEDRQERPSAPPRAAFLNFEYQAAPANTVDWQQLSQQLIDGDLTIEEVQLQDGEWCRYEAQPQPTAAQVNPDLVPLEQTRAPYLSAFGHPRSMGFSFLITAIQSRNQAPPCGRLETTVQGLDMASAEGAASGEWRPGNTVVVVSRPELRDAWLGSPLEFTNRSGDQRLYFEHAVNSVSPEGYVQGAFRFMVLSTDGRFVLLARNGEFGMRSQP